MIQTSTPVDITIQSETDLLINNVMDSLLLMEMVLLIEAQWGVQLDGNDIAPANFRTVTNLANLIIQRMAGGKGKAAA